MAAAEILLMFAVADISYQKRKEGKMKEYKKLVRISFGKQGYNRGIKRKMIKYIGRILQNAQYRAMM